MTTTPPITQPLSCLTDTGKHVMLGHSLTEGCRTCDCTYHGLNCMYMDCLPPMCVDYVTRDGCCYTCPHGQNCRIPSGEIITDPVERDGMRCECPRQSYSLPGVPSAIYSTAICTPTSTIPVTTTTTTPTTPFGCVTDDGRHIPLGQSVTDLEPGACRICECGREGLTCMYGDCLAPMCVDYVRSGCCYRCPNGPNCRLPSGEIISGPVERDGMRCECPPQDRGLPGAPSASHTTAICTPRTTIPIVG